MSEVLDPLLDAVDLLLKTLDSDLLFLYDILKLCESSFVLLQLSMMIVTGTSGPLLPFLSFAFVDPEYEN